MTLRAPTIYLIAFAVLACTSEKSNPVSNHWVGIGRATAGGLVVELGTDTRLETGLTPIHIRLTTSDGVAVTDAPIRFEPLMSMANGKQHTCPTIGNPVLADDGVYHTAAVFQMPSSEMDCWSATVRVSESDAEANAATFDNLTVVDSGRAQTFSYQAPEAGEARKFVVSLNFTTPPRVGLNPIVFTLHEMKDMMTFLPVDDAGIAVDPQMPSMGHGSPGSVNPKPASLGRYEGQLSFSMAGTWETTVAITRAGVTLGTPKFTTAF